MAESRRQTRSAGARSREQQLDAQFFSNQPDPLMIERGQHKAIQLVQSRVNTTTRGVSGANTTDRVPQMVFVDDEGMEEQFLTEDEASWEVTDITANQVMTPVENEEVPLDPIYTQRSQRDEELDLQPSRGPKEESLVNTLDQYLGEDYKDVLCTSNIQMNFSISVSNRDITG